MVQKKKLKNGTKNSNGIIAHKQRRLCNGTYAMANNGTKNSNGKRRLCNGKQWHYGGVLPIKNGEISLIAGNTPCSPFSYVYFFL